MEEEIARIQRNTGGNVRRKCQGKEDEKNVAEGGNKWREGTGRKRGRGTWKVSAR